MEDARGAQGAPVGASPGWTPTLGQLLALIAVYCAFHTLSRGLISETLGVDDAEQVLLAQRWDWGYGPQPPFYTWLTLAFCGVFGWSAFTMALLKNILLFVLYISSYFAARRITRSHVAGVVAAVGLQFMPSIAWEAERELTHSILASMMVMATLWVFLCLKRDRWGGYWLLGLCAGFGTISKYNYAVSFAALLLGALSLKEWRPLVLNRKMAVALLAGAAIVAPNAVWCVLNPGLASASVYKLQIAEASGLGTAIKGLAAWGQTALEQAAPIAGVFLLLNAGLLMRRKRRQLLIAGGAVALAILSLSFHAGEPFAAGRFCLRALGWWVVLAMLDAVIFEKRAAEPPSEGERLLWRMFAAAGLLIGISVCAFSVTYSHNRWMQPIMIPAPVLMAAAWSGSLKGLRLKALLWLGAIISVGMCIGQPLRIVLTESLGKYEILNAPFRRLAADLKEPVSKAEYIYANERWLAGNLRVWFPEKGITIPEMTNLFKPPQDCMIIWEDSANPAENRDHCLAEARRSLGREFGGTEYYSERFKYYRGTNAMRLGVRFPLEAKP